MDFASIIGPILGVALILLGNKLEHGTVESLIGPASAMIVFGGAAGAVILQFTGKTLLLAVGGLKTVLLGVKTNPILMIGQIVDFATRARREGILALEKELPNISDPFFSKALNMAVDGLEPDNLYNTMETELGTIEEGWKKRGEVWEAAGGYLPTIGIIGAVLGLIVVMQDLTDIDKVGSGIAAAFVATIYGLVGANMICLPIAGKIHAAGKEEVKIKEMVLKGVLLIQEGINYAIIS